MYKNPFNNPFEITKATDFSDVQINEYWVSLNSDEFSMLNPTGVMPKYILGGKGCGKTHLLRYHSFQLQKIRKSNIQSIIQEDQYIGIYSVLDGINSSRFKDKGIKPDQWESAFEYYFELYLTEILLNIIQDIYKSAIEIYNECDFVKDVLSLFYEKSSLFNKCITLNDLIQLISNIRKQIDIQIVNVAFTRRIDIGSVKILFTSGDLIFGIPKILSEKSSIFSNVNFVYILDEYEKLFEWQKIFINTLVWEKKRPATFWIGARKYGYTTRATKTGELIRAGSEFEPVELDDIFQKNEGIYVNFAKELYKKRLENFYKETGPHNDFVENFSEKFEKYSDDVILQKINKKFQNKKFRHILEFKRKLKQGIEKNLFIEPIKIDEIVDNLLSDVGDQPLEQKYKLYIFYREWSNWDNANSKISNSGSIVNKIDAKKIVEYINREYKDFQNNKTEGDLYNVKEKYKSDLIAQLAYESNIKNTCYSGIDEFITLSWGNPRVFLLILKLIIEKSDLLAEKPLDVNSKISLESQYLGVYETAQWFYHDVEIIGDRGKNLYKCITNLTNIFQLYRFSSKPTETSVSTFNFGVEELSSSALDYINLAKMHSLIVEVNPRKQKNSGKIESTYQLNRILAPKWDLPTSRRGIADFDASLVEVIFNPDSFAKYDTKYKELKSRLTPPFIKTAGNKKNNEDVDQLLL